MAVPVLLGMACRGFSPTKMKRLELGLRKFSVFFLVVLIAMILGNERAKVFNNLSALGGATFLLALLGLVYGYGIGKILRLGRDESVAIAFALPVQGTALVGTVAISVLHNINYGIPAGIYSIFMYVAGFIGVAVFTKFK